jgi:prolyl-tRNA editing enzyme YbaK/EbsC (Cys-tRNA(Pro) deacylase)
VREVTGYAIGGVPPLGHVSALPVYMEQTLLDWPAVYAAAGAPDALFPIDPNVLQQITGAVVVQVT